MHNWHLLIAVLAVIGTVASFSERSHLHGPRDCNNGRVRDFNLNRIDINDRRFKNEKDNARLNIHRERDFQNREIISQRDKENREHVSNEFNSRNRELYSRERNLNENQNDKAENRIRSRRESDIRLFTRSLNYENRRANVRSNVLLPKQRVLGLDRDEFTSLKGSLYASRGYDLTRRSQLVSRRTEDRNRIIPNRSHISRSRRNTDNFENGDSGRGESRIRMRDQNRRIRESSPHFSLHPQRRSSRQIAENAKENINLENLQHYRSQNINSNSAQRRTENERRARITRAAFTEHREDRQDRARQSLENNRFSRDYLPNISRGTTKSDVTREILKVRTDESVQDRRQDSREVSTPSNERVYIIERRMNSERQLGRDKPIRESHQLSRITRNDYRNMGEFSSRRDTQQFRKHEVRNNERNRLNERNSAIRVLPTRDRIDYRVLNQREPVRIDKVDASISLNNRENIAVKPSETHAHSNKHVTEWKMLIFYALQGLYLSSVFWSIISRSNKSGKDKSIFNFFMNRGSKTVKVE